MKDYGQKDLVHEALAILKEKGWDTTALREEDSPTATPSLSKPSGLSSWPIQLKLVPPNAPFLEGADLLIGCPKLDAAASGQIIPFAEAIVGLGGQLCSDPK